MLSLEIGNFLLPGCQGDLLHENIAMLTEPFMIARLLACSFVHQQGLGRLVRQLAPGTQLVPGSPLVWRTWPCTGNGVGRRTGQAAGRFRLRRSQYPHHTDLLTSFHCQSSQVAFKWSDSIHTWKPYVRCIALEKPRDIPSRVLDPNDQIC